MILIGFYAISQIPFCLNFASVSVKVLSCICGQRGAQDSLLLLLCILNLFHIFLIARETAASWCLNQTFNLCIAFKI